MGDCSRCNKTLSSRWEQDSATIDISIGICSCSFNALFGDNEKQYGKDHPAINSDKSGYQGVLIEIGKSKDYKLCWHCHREMVRMIGDFITKKPY